MDETSPGGYVFGHPEVAADCGAVADGDASEDGGVRVDYDVVFKDGVTRDVLDGMAVGVEGETLGTQGDALVKFDIIAYNARGADNDTRAVVYGEVMAYLRRRVDVDARFAVGQFCQNARDKRYAELEQLVGHAVVGQRLDDGLLFPAGRRVGG